jgi:hypothetical protein
MCLQQGSNSNFCIQKPRNRAPNIGAKEERRTGIKEKREPKELGWQSGTDLCTSRRRSLGPASCPYGDRVGISSLASAVSRVHLPRHCPLPLAVAATTCGFHDLQASRNEPRTPTPKEEGKARKNDAPWNFLEARTLWVEQGRGGIAAGAVLATKTKTSRRPRLRPLVSARRGTNGLLVIRPLLLALLALAVAHLELLSRRTGAEQFTEHLDCFPEAVFCSPRTEADGAPARRFSRTGERGRGAGA